MEINREDIINALSDLCQKKTTGETEEYYIRKPNIKPYEAYTSAKYDIIYSLFERFGITNEEASKIIGKGP